MKKYILIFSVAVGFALAVKPACADDEALPGEGFAASHYETLWTKSPFSVATPDAVDSSPDYNLVGITQLEGVAYASVVDAHSGDHFLISSDKENKGLKLIAITRSRNGSDTYASVQKDGQPLTLKLQSAAAAPATPGAPGTMPGAQPQIMVPPVTQNIQMPGVGNQIIGGAPNPTNPFPPRPPRVHRPVIHLPPMPPGQDGGANQAIPPAPGTPPPADSSGGQQPVQTHTVPPSQ